MKLNVIRDQIREADNTPISNAVLALLDYIGTLETRVVTLERRQQPTNAVSPYDLSAARRLRGDR